MLLEPTLYFVHLLITKLWIETFYWYIQNYEPNAFLDKIPYISTYIY